ncbi:MAG: hypothetical protein K9I68_00105 [Bacteroidales bacterium]|nr:hypothetical protein [Bacteroidales bacterium]MCF8336774.1 hypothetical protein [Bacteroidales bacterium]
MRNVIFSIVTATMAIGLFTLQSCEEDNDGSTNQEPTCSITNPSFGDEITQGETVTISVEAEDEDDNLKEVRFYIDGTGVGSSDSFPYNYDWETGDASEGSHTIKAVAEDDEQAEAEDEVEVTVVSGGGGGGGTTGTFTDPRDGQTYETVEIGNQVWFAENLNYETDNSWCYDNDPDNGDTYGRLYNWEAALDACPDGWHLPSDEEWKTLEMELGMSQSEADDDGWRGYDQGEQMKSTSGWNSNGNGTNSSGFSALPGGFRHSDGSFYTLGNIGHWWSATEFSGSYAWFRVLGSGRDQVHRDGSDKAGGYSVRCLKD